MSRRAVSGEHLARLAHLVRVEPGRERWVARVGRDGGQWRKPGGHAINGIMNQRTPGLKPLAWVGSALDDVRVLPAAARDAIGHEQ